MLRTNKEQDKKFLVIWRGDEDDFMQTEVYGKGVITSKMDDENWVEVAALAEGYSPDELRELFDRGYELICVCDMPDTFYNT